MFSSINIIFYHLCPQTLREEDRAEDRARPPSPFLIIADKMVSGPVILNVGGKKYEQVLVLVLTDGGCCRHEVRWDTLDKFPTSRLGRLRHCVTHRGNEDTETTTTTTTCRTQGAL